MASVDLTVARLPYSDNLRLAAIVRQGLPARSIQDIAKQLGVPLSRLAPIMQIPLRTLQRRVEQGARLKPQESERAIRVGRLLKLAKDVFEDEGAAAEWFAKPLQTLGGRSPLDSCTTEPGAREVEQLLGRIAHGVFA